MCPVSHRHPFSWMYVIYPKALGQLNQQLCILSQKAEGSAIEDSVCSLSAHDIGKAFWSSPAQE